jgi:hypothetical protein
VALQSRMQYEWDVPSSEPCQRTSQHINVSGSSGGSKDSSNERVPGTLNIFEVGLQSHKILRYSADVTHTALGLPIISFYSLIWSLCIIKFSSEIDFMLLRKATLRCGVSLIRVEEMKKGKPHFSSTLLVNVFVYFSFDSDRNVSVAEIIGRII